MAFVAGRYVVGFRRCRVMNDPSFYRDKADHYRRLLKIVHDPRVIAEVEEAIRQYDEQAARAEALQVPDGAMLSTAAG